jgi:hypothetical protein
MQSVQLLGCRPSATRRAPSWSASPPGPRVARDAGGRSAHAHRPRWPGAGTACAGAGAVREIRGRAHAAARGGGRVPVEAGSGVSRGLNRCSPAARRSGRTAAAKRRAYWPDPVSGGSSRNQRRVRSKRDWITAARDAGTALLQCVGMPSSLAQPLRQAITSGVHAGRCSFLSPEIHNLVIER